MLGENLINDYRIQDRRGEKIVSVDDFPLIIGGSPTAHIRIENLDEMKEVAFIGISEGHLYVQAAETGIPIHYNQEQLKGSVWLFHGDKLRINSHEIAFQVEDHRIVFQVSEINVSKQIPQKASPLDSFSAIEIEPISFRVNPGRRSWKLSTLLKGAILLSLGFIFSLLLITIWFIFTARHVTISIEPEPDQILITGNLMAPRFEDYYLLRPGEYKLKADKKGYHSLDQPMKVTKEKSQAFEFTMDKLPGRLTLKVHPVGKPSLSIKGAQVFVDGEEIGAAPLENQEIKPGQRRIEIRAKNFQSLKTDLEIQGRGILQSYDLALSPSWANVTIRSVPKGAQVRINGKKMGKTPLSLKLSEGIHKLELSAHRYKNWRTKLVVKPNQPKILDPVHLQPADGKLALKTTPPNANVTVDETFLGQTPLDVPLIPDTDHVVHISKTGYKKVVRTVNLSPGGFEDIHVDLVPVKGVVHFLVEPKGAELLINGQSRGIVQEKLQLLAVKQKIEIKKEGYEVFHTTITPRPGFPQELKVVLTKKAQKKSATTSSMIQASNGYTLKLIRPSSFVMGSSRREQGRRSNETLRKVTLKRPFYMGIKEVTNKEFRAFLSSHNSGSFNGYSLNRDEQPVVQVTWKQAARFCNWLSQKDSLQPVYVEKGDQVVAPKALGTGYRLPTEAEWEYCARYKTSNMTLKYPWGDSYPPTQKSLNIADYSARKIVSFFLENYDDGYPVSAPPAAFKANNLGLFDLGGNVAEWSHDYYSIYPYKAEKVYIDPSGPKQGKHHVIKGSSWKNAGISSLRLAAREYGNDKRADLGFRLCRYADDGLPKK